MPGYSRVPRGRYPSPNIDREIDPGFSRDDGLGDRTNKPRFSKRKSGRYAPKKPGKFATKRSRDFIEGQLFERDRMDGYRDPPQPAEGNYTDRRFGPMRIGYRS